MCACRIRETVSEIGEKTETAFNFNTLWYLVEPDGTFYDESGLIFAL